MLPTFVSRHRAKWLFLCCVALAWLAPFAFVQQAHAGPVWWLPHNVSTNGITIDRIFYVILYITGTVFVVVQAVLIIFVLKYRARPGERAQYTHGNNRLEVIWTIIPAVFLGVLALVSQQVWGGIRPQLGYRGTAEGPGNPVVIEIVAQQFAWNIRYPGPDGVFGPRRMDADYITSTNFIGLDRDHPASADDIVGTQNILHIPMGRPIQVRLASMDVLHSFFLPNFRVKQDAVPGMQVNVFFDALEAGTYPIACAELCGALHATMEGKIIVHESDEAFNAWLAEQPTIATR